jgi:hypothetical protein
VICRCDGCFRGKGGRCLFNSVGSRSITYSGTNSTNSTGVITIYSSTARDTNTLSPTALARQIDEFARRLARIKPQRPIVKVDERKLIKAPTRAHAKPHQAASSRAAMSVRQFASRVK